jgi:hypothetical protein
MGRGKRYGQSCAGGKAPSSTPLTTGVSSVSEEKYLAPTDARRAALVPHFDQSKAVRAINKAYEEASDAAKKAYEETIAAADKAREEARAAAKEALREALREAGVAARTAFDKAREEARAAA